MNPLPRLHIVFNKELLEVGKNHGSLLDYVLDLKLLFCGGHVVCVNNCSAVTFIARTAPRYKADEDTHTLHLEALSETPPVPSSEYPCLCGEDLGEGR